MFGNLTIQEIAIYVIAFLLGVTVHEYAHARMALAAGDDTAKRMGRVSLNPLDHLDPIGTVMFVFTILNGFGIAWGKPVPVNPYTFKKPRWDTFRVSIAGVVANFITAVILAFILRFVVNTYIPGYAALLETCMFFNLGLAFFNMIPVPPLDGSKVLASLLPPRWARWVDLVVSRYGIFILLMLVLVPIGGRSVVGWILWPAVDAVGSLLLKFAYLG